MGITLCPMPRSSQHSANARPKNARPKQTPRQLLADPERLTISVAQAAEVLGISRATASHAYRRTGYVTEGVRVLRIGKRCVVSTSELRKALGLPEPDKA